MAVDTQICSFCGHLWNGSDNSVCPNCGERDEFEWPKNSSTNTDGEVSRRSNRNPKSNCDRLKGEGCGQLKKRTWLGLTLLLLAFIMWSAFTAWYYLDYWPVKYSNYRSDGLIVDPAPLPQALGLVLVVTLAISYR